MNLVDILITRQREKENYFKNWRRYCKDIKEIAEEFLKGVKLLAFGSIIENKWNPNSDIDVLIICDNLPENLEKRQEFRTKIKARISPFSPFQLHLATFSEFEGWYKGFIKGEYIEIK